MDLALNPKTTIDQKSDSGNNIVLLDSTYLLDNWILVLSSIIPTLHFASSLRYVTQTRISKLDMCPSVELGNTLKI